MTLFTILFPYITFLSTRISGEEMITSGLQKFVCCFLFLILIMLCWPFYGISQQTGIAYDDYIKAIGLEDDHIVMKNILRNELINRVDDKPEAYYKDNAEFFSMVLLVSGVRPNHFYTLQQNGVDVINAMTSDVRPFGEQSLFADVAVTGKVVEIIPESLEGDGFDLTLKIEISDLLKGDLPSDTIRIRQRNLSRLSGSDTRPELSESYLFLLSSGMYGYHKANHLFRQEKEVVVSPPNLGREEIFLIYRMYPYVNGQLQRAHENKTAAFRSLRMIDNLLKR